LWRACGSRIEEDVTLRPIDPFYEVRFDDGDVFRYTSNLELMREQIARIDPRDVQGFERFLAVSRDIFEVAFKGQAEQPFHEIGTLMRAAPDLIRLGGYRSVYSEVSRFFKSEKLRVLFSFHPLLIGGNPFTTTAYYCLIAHLERTYGVHYAEGGTGALVNGFVRLIGRLGGTLRCNAEVAEILVENGTACGVRLVSGEEIRADIVVSNADAAFTYSRLLARHPRRRWTDAKIARARYSMSLFVWYFGTRRRWDEVYHHTMVLGPRYRGLLDDIFRHKVLAKDCSLYLHRPSASDPSLAPAGCDAIYVLAPVPHLQSGTDWRVEAEPYRAAVQRRLEETVLPGLGESIVSSRVLTPLDFRDRLSSVNGAAFAMEPQLFQSAWFRPHNVSEEVRGLYLVGAGTHPGAGLPGVVSSANILDRIVPDPGR
jgi:phytoene desaturase